MVSIIASIKNILNYVVNELVNTMIGFIVGLTTSNFMLSFFEVEGWQNIWGLWSSKLVLNEHLFTAIQWMISITIGYIFMKGFNYLISKFKILKQRTSV